MTKVLGVKIDEFSIADALKLNSSIGKPTIMVVENSEVLLVLPPKIALNKVVIVPIIFDKTKEATIKKANEIKHKLLEKIGDVDD